VALVEGRARPRAIAVMNCSHQNRVDPPPGKRLRVCLDCLHRIAECNTCDATLVASSDAANSGWRKYWRRDSGGPAEFLGYLCADCQRAAEW